MQLKPFLAPMSRAERLTFAKNVGTSAGHLANASYGYAPLNPAICVAIERESDRIVTRQELRPKDWRAIWPELAGIGSVVEGI